MRHPHLGRAFKPHAHPKTDHTCPIFDEIIRHFCNMHSAPPRSRFVMPGILLNIWNNFSSTICHGRIPASPSTDAILYLAPRTSTCAKAPPCRNLHAASTSQSPLLPCILLCAGGLHPFAAALHRLPTRCRTRVVVAPAVSIRASLTVCPTHRGGG